MELFYRCKFLTARGKKKRKKTPGRRILRRSTTNSKKPSKSAEKKWRRKLRTKKDFLEKDALSADEDEDFSLSAAEEKPEIRDPEEEAREEEEEEEVEEEEVVEIGSTIKKKSFKKKKSTSTKMVTDLIKKYGTPGENRYMLCKLCSYRSNVRQYFKNHIFRHMKRNGEGVFAPAGAKKVAALTKLPHGKTKSMEEILGKYADKCDEEGYLRCKQCNYKSNVRRYFVDHAYGHIRHEAPNHIVPMVPEFPVLKDGKLLRVKESDILTVFATQPNDPVLQCCQCEHKFADREQFSSHVLQDHASKGRVFACPSCPEIFPTQRDRLNHICPNKSNKTLEKYAVDYKPGTEVQHLQCNQCSYNTNKKEHFLRHVSHRHKNRQSLECNDCGKVFYQKYLLSKHIQEIHFHNVRRNFECDICLRRFTQRRYMEEHRNIHTGLKPFICDICGKTFACNASLNVHRRLELGIKKYKCDVCDRAFLNRATLRNHFVEKHTDERNYTCSTCGKTFKSAATLRGHFVVHSEERPFKCEFCDGWFKSRNLLRQHHKVHNKKNTPHTTAPSSGPNCPENKQQYSEEQHHKRQSTSAAYKSIQDGTFAEMHQKRSSDHVAYKNMQHLHDAYGEIQKRSNSSYKTLHSVPNLQTMHNMQTMQNYFFFN